ncbi:uncharacterized protein BX663DRAFT_462833, partial [Cokeromyces recurvatus]|uniref:uncharacterized protein n=1 Tax=Cokeromyces recurvatus TaxID=90255 RepID=UPI00221FBAE7
EREREYKQIYFPLYSSKLYPADQFWLLIKSNVRRSQFSDKEDIHSRITKSYDNIPHNTIKTFVQYSNNVFV